MSPQFDSLLMRVHEPAGAEAEPAGAEAEEIRDVPSVPVVSSGDGSPSECPDSVGVRPDKEPKYVIKRERLPGSKGGWRCIRVLVAESEPPLPTEELQLPVQQLPPPKAILCSESDPEERSITSKVNSGLTPKQRLAYMARGSKVSESKTSKIRKAQTVSGAALVAAVPASIQQRLPSVQSGKSFQRQALRVKAKTTENASAPRAPVTGYEAAAAEADRRDTATSPEQRPPYMAWCSKPSDDREHKSSQEKATVEQHNSRELQARQQKMQQQNTTTSQAKVQPQAALAAVSALKSPGGASQPGASRGHRACAESSSQSSSASKATRRSLQSFQQTLQRQAIRDKAKTKEDTSAPRRGVTGSGASASAAAKLVAFPSRSVRHTP